LLYRVLTGISPPDAQSRLVEDGEIIAEPMILNEQISEKVSKAIMNGLTLSAENRTKTVVELAEQLFGKARTGDISTSKTLTGMPISSTFWNTTDEGLPVNPEAEVDTADEVTEKSAHPKFDADLVEAVEKSLRKEAREKQRKIKMAIVICSIVAVIIFFVVLIIMASNGHFVRPPDYAETTDPSATTGEPDTTTPEATAEGEVTQGNNVLVRGFEGLNFREEWVTDFPNLVFKFEPEYSATRPKGLVFSQSLKEGDLVPVGSEIVIQYSLGREFIKLSDLPRDHVGMTIGELRTALNGLGVEFENIRVGDSSTRFSENMANQIVGGVNFDPDSNIRLTTFPGSPTRLADLVIITIAAPQTTTTSLAATTTTTAPPATTTVEVTAPPVVTTTEPPATPYIPEPATEPPLAE
jgi:hypothetical protein